MKALQALHSDNAPVLCIDFVEAVFSWEEGEKSAPILRPWIGFWHNPAGVAPGSYPSFWKHSPQAVIRSGKFQASLPYCRGIFTLCTELAKQLKVLLPRNIVIEHVFHPTEQDESIPRFTMDKYHDNDHPVILVLGYWLRVLHAPYAIKTKKPKYWYYGNNYAKQVFGDECERVGTNHYHEGVVWHKHVSNAEYDDLLSKNVVFIQLYDSSANNTVVECIVRQTPLIINRLPALEEYLGSDYPGFYESLDEAETMLNDDVCIDDAHQYLKTNSEQLCCRLTAESFMRQVATSKIYTGLRP